MAARKRKPIPKKFRAKRTESQKRGKAAYDKMHNTDKRRVMAAALREPAGTELLREGLARGAKKVAGRPGAYTTKPGGKIKYAKRKKSARKK